MSCPHFYIGNVYIADTENHRIRMVSASTGNISTIAGDGNDNGDKAIVNDVSATSASLNRPYDVAIDASGSASTTHSLTHSLKGLLLLRYALTYNHTN